MSRAFFEKFFGNRVVRAGVLLFSAMAAGLFLGHETGIFLKVKGDMGTVAVRVGHPKSESDYDFEAAVDFLEYTFKKKGYKVLERAYTGNLYPKRLNGAGINVFVRGFPVFLDLRMRHNGVNLYYLHRFSNFYQEELKNFDVYLSSQKRFINAAARSRNIKAQFLPGGFVPHEALLRDKNAGYEYDVLYIYEFYNRAFDVYIQRFKKSKVYSGTEFAQFSVEERAKELNKAKVVVYEMGEPGLDDFDYVPYAVYDLISFGRPLVTNRKKAFEQHFGDTVFMFETQNGLFEATSRALGLDDAAREETAVEARRILYKQFGSEIPAIDGF